MFTKNEPDNSKASIAEYLKQCDHHYYNLDDPLISDIEYDVLKRQLGKEYDYVPGEALFNKVKHDYPVTSLDKVQSKDIDRLKKELVRLGIEEYGVCVQPKLDGLTIVKYPHGPCVTRGDGEEGEDVTANAEQISELKTIRHLFPIRTEVMMLKSAFETINKEREEEGLDPYKNTRNAASGMLRNLDNSKVKGLIAIAYDLIGYDESQEDIIGELVKIADIKNIVNTWHFYDIDNAIDFILNFDVSQYDYDLDGLVIKSNRPQSLAHYGSTGHHPCNAIAVKYETPCVWTDLERIVWQVGRTGKVVPVAEFKPVELLGSTVERATLHNIAYIKALGLNHYAHDLYHRSQVAITKANMIIPAVLDVKHPNVSEGYYVVGVYEPEVCPDCGQPLDKVKDQVFCRNDNCKERVITQAIHMCSKVGLDIKGLNEETIRKMYDVLVDPQEYGYIFPLLFTEPIHYKALDGFADKSADKASKAMTKALSGAKMSKFLAASGVPLVGKSKAKLIAKKFNSLDQLANDLITGGRRLNLINAVGKEIIASLNKHWDRVVLLHTYIENIESEYEEPKSKTVNQKSFVITGILEESREYYVKIIEAAGHKVSGSVSKKTHAVLTGDKAGSKLDKAEELGIKIIKTKSELMEEL